MSDAILVTSEIADYEIFLKSEKLKWWNRNGGSEIMEHYYYL